MTGVAQPFRAARDACRDDGFAIALRLRMFHRRPRLRTFSYIGIYRYFLTFHAHDRCTPFTTAAVVTPVWLQILAAARKHAFEVIAYVFMPDHFHMLVEGLEDSSDLKAFAALAKQRSAYTYAQDGRGRLWQPSFYDSVLREEDDTPSVIRYILHNPVAAGLVDSHREYPFLGSSRYTIEELEERARDGREWRPGSALTRQSATDHEQP